MTSYFVKTLTRGLPPRRFVVAFLVVAGTIVLGEAAFIAAVNWWVGQWQDPALAEQFSHIRSHNFLLLLGVAGTALWRASAFNPALDRRYAEWLRSTPWTVARPLPLGFAHLMWQDAVMIGAAAYLWTSSESRAVVVLAFAVPYCLCMAGALFGAGEMWSVCGAAALAVGLLLTIGRPPWQGAALAVGLCAYCDWAFRRALVRFPWDNRMGLLHQEQSGVSWHWPRLRDGGIVTNEPAVPWRWAATLSMLAGWLAGVLAELCTLNIELMRHDAEFQRGAWYVVWLFCMFCALLRMVGYVGDRSSPLGLWARVRLGRWIIPGHDRVYLAPLAVLAIGSAMLPALFWLGMPVPAAVGLTVMCALLIALGAPPTVAEWSLTGEHRLRVRRPGMRKDWVRAG